MASKTFQSAQSYHCKKINSANNLRGFGSTLFFSQVFRWEHSPAKTFNAPWGEPIVETPTKLF